MINNIPKNYRYLWKSDNLTYWNSGNNYIKLLDKYCYKRSSILTYLTYLLGKVVQD